MRMRAIRSMKAVCLKWMTSTQTWTFRAPTHPSAPQRRVTFGVPPSLSPRYIIHFISKEAEETARFLAASPHKSGGNLMKHAHVATVVLLVSASLFAADRQTDSDALRVQAAMVAAPLSCSSAPTLTCSIPITSSPSCLSQGYYVDIYTFSAQAGQKITVTATTLTGYRMAIVITDSSANMLASDYGLSPFSMTYTFAAAGTYYIHDDDQAPRPTSMRPRTCGQALKDGAEVRYMKKCPSGAEEIQNQAIV
jgi:Bacterial pre-peptidase C-terminal domain